MSFWDEHKAGIISGAKTVVKTTASATKGIAKGGYNAYKNREGNTNSSSSRGSTVDHSYVPLSSLKDPHNFPAPPKHRDWNRTEEDQLEPRMSFEQQGQGYQPNQQMGNSTNYQNQGYQNQNYQNQN